MRTRQAIRLHTQGGKVNEYTHATIFRNNSWTGQGTNVGAFFHSSEKLAQGKKKELDRSDHLEFIEIVELEII